MNYIEIEELLKVGAHFGHPTSKWNPKFSPYIVTKKNGVHIIDLNQTNICLNNAIQELTKIIKGNGNVLFVGTKKQAKDVVQQAADKCGMYYIVERWLGGTLTNFCTIKRSIKRLFLLDKESSDTWSSFTKAFIFRSYRSPSVEDIRCATSSSFVTSQGPNEEPKSFPFAGPRLSFISCICNRNTGN